MVKAVESVIKEKAVFFSISFRFSLEETEKERAILVLKVKKKSDTRNQGFHASY